MQGVKNRYLSHYLPENSSGGTNAGWISLQSNGEVLAGKN